MGLKQLKISKFLSKLYDLINDKKYSDDINWNKNGTSFIIKNYHNFCYNIMPKIFGLNLFSSFHHQLNCYGFTKINVHEYFNKFFKKDNKNLLLNIKRRRKNNLKEKNRINLNRNNNNINNNDNILYLLERIQYKLNIIKYRRKNVEEKLYSMQKKQEYLINENAFLRQKLLEAQTKQKDLGYIFFSMVENLYPEFSLIKKQCLYFINSEATISLTNSNTDNINIKNIEENNVNSINNNNNLISKEYNLYKIDSGISMCNTQDTKTQEDLDYFNDVE